MGDWAEAALIGGAAYLINKARDEWNAGHEAARRRVDAGAGYAWPSDSYTPQVTGLIGTTLNKGPRAAARKLSRLQKKGMRRGFALPIRPLHNFRLRIKGRRYKKPRSLRRRRGRRYRRTRRTLVRRYPRRRIRFVRSRLRGRRGLRRRRYGRRGARRYRRRQGFAARVRKIAGDCFNQVVVKDYGSLMPSTSSVNTRINYPVIFRLMSSWYNTREDMLRLMSGCMSGPSTTAGTDLNLNRHLWIQGGVRVTQRLRNPNNYPIYIQIYKCSLKCDDVGPTAGTYVEGTLPFAVGSPLNTYPSDTYWDFFDQSSRSQTGGATDTGYMKFTGDAIMAFNSDGSYSNVSQPANAWERGYGGIASIDFRERVKLSWIFPNIKKKLRVRTVFAGWIPALGSRTYSYSASFPSELRPRDYLTNERQSYSKNSYFLLARAFAEPIMASATVGNTQEQDNLAAVLQTRALSYVPWAYSRPPPNFVTSEQRVYRIRRGGDSVPSFASVLAKSPPPAGGGAGGGGWLGPLYGLTSQGSIQEDPTIWASSNTLAGGTATFTPIVPSFRQHAMLENTGRPGWATGGNAIMSLGAK